MHIRCGKTYGSTDAVVSASATEVGILQLDISSVTGNHYVWVRKFTGSSSFGESTYSKIWLE
jgi:hypothetical protein